MGDRIKLVIKTDPQEKEYKGRKYWEFNALMPDGTTPRLSCWEQQLIAFLAKDSTPDSEVISKQSDGTDANGNHYINRKVVNVYVDNKPVLSSPAKGNYQREDPDQKRRCMAISYAKDLCVAGKIQLDQISVYAKKFDDFIAGK